MMARLVLQLAVLLAPLTAIAAVRPAATPSISPSAHAAAATSPWTPYSRAPLATTTSSDVSLSGSGTTLAAVVNGSVHVYGLKRAVWTLQAKLSGPGFVGGSAVGQNVLGLDAAGVTLVVAGGASCGFGCAHVYRRKAGGVAWTLAAQLAPLDAAGSTAFPLSVAVSGDGAVVAIGSPNDAGEAGAAFIFERLGGRYVQAGRKLVGQGGDPFPRMGAQLALDRKGTTLASATDGGANARTGWVFVFSRGKAGAWAQVAKLAGGEDANTLQAALALSGDGRTLACVHPAPGVGGYEAVAVYTLGSGGKWKSAGPLIGHPGPRKGDAGAGFAASLALSDDGAIMAVGAPFDGSFDAQSGGAWVFRRRAGGGWEPETVELEGPGASRGAHQGQSVALDAAGRVLAVAGGGTQYGVVYAGGVWVWHS